MKWGILISLVLLAILITATIITTRGFPDKPSSLTTNPDNLKTFDGGRLPALPGSPGGGDGTAAFDALVKEYLANSADLQAQAADNSPLTDGQRIADMFLQLYKAGPPSAAAIDSLVPMKPRASCDIAFNVLAGVAMRQADELLEKDREKAKQIATAVFTTGSWIFSNTKRLPMKGMGLIVMIEGLDRLYNWSKKDADLAPAADAWMAALNNFQEKNYNPKFDLVVAVETKSGGKQKNYGDLLKICFDDKDIAWRVEATLSLGIAKFAPNRGRGNDRAILNAIENLKSDKEPLVAQAAKAADAMKKDDVRAN